MERPLEGQVALVTGGAGRFGSAISRRLAADGATVVINGRDEAKARNLQAELQATGSTVDVRIASVRDEDQVQEMIAGIESDHGRLDIVVNNAGGVGGAGGKAAYVHEMSRESWSNVLDLNLTAAFVCTKAAMPGMIERRYGRFVNISSAGYFGIIGLASYAAAKAGLNAFTATVALEVSDHGITANVVAPHLVESGRDVPNEIRQTLLAPVPIRRYGKPAEIAAAVAYLASPDAGYVSGEIIHVMGGMKWLGPDLDMAIGLKPRNRTAPDDAPSRP